MKAITQHLVRCFVAGIVAILPVGGLIIMVVYFESTIAGSALTKLPFYFPGLGLLSLAVLVYAIGLTVTTFVGKWVWNKVDSLLNNLPALGKLYLTLKEILGYGQGEEAIFHETVLVSSKEQAGQEFGLVTNRIELPDGTAQLVVLIPGAPNPTMGRLIITEPDTVTPVDFPVNDFPGQAMLRNADSHHAASDGIGFKDGYGIAILAQEIGGGQACRSGTNDGNLFLLGYRYLLRRRIGATPESTDDKGAL